jgi:hypothetical protein
MAEKKLSELNKTKEQLELEKQKAKGKREIKNTREPDK